jgi:hypothetical protein
VEIKSEGSTMKVKASAIRLLIATCILSSAAQGGRDFELLFRLYGPEKALFDKTWVLPDAEKVK